ncbi:hypothetical protein H6F56_01220 [Microcoleus sp. FACHB-672]|nr:hypothetical protein [Microcoleus sp. FACHB-672]
MAEISDFYSEKGGYLEQNGFKASNLERLKIVISYFSYLNAKGEISDQALKALVRYACSIFIENEVESRVEAVLEQKLSQFWNTNFSSSLEDFLSREIEKSETSQVTKTLSLR